MKASLRVFLTIALSTVTAYAQDIDDDTSNDSNNSTEYGGTPTRQEGDRTVHIVSVAKVNHEFQPNSIRAEIGDIVSFQFFPTNHSVVRAAYGYPCVPYEYVKTGGRGFNSGFEPIAIISDNPPTWNLTVDSTEPIFYYCGAPGSCNDWGMIGSINANASQPISTQIRLAKEAHYALLPGEPFPDEREDELTSIAATATTATVTATPVGAGADAAEATSDSSDGEDEDESGDGGGSSLSTGAIVGIAIGAVAAVALFAALFFYIGRTRNYKKAIKRKETEEQRQSQAPHQGGSSPFMAQGGYFDPNNRHASGQLPPYSQVYRPSQHDAQKPEDMARMSEHQMTPPLRGTSPPIGSPEMQHPMQGFAPLDGNMQYR
ncbi:hypothetical protein MBLNU230_g5515t1 [Neophaeotheca triangularis]